MSTGDKVLLMFFILFCVAAIVQLFYYLWFYLAPALLKPAEKKESREPVSVIICARNEAENLASFLPSILEQDYPSFEVIVVNDCSEDNSDDVLGSLLQRYPNLRVSSINKDPKFTHSKKFAQFIGIKAATNDILIFTDADCQPESDKWLDQMASNFDNKTNFVLGYGGYLPEKGLLNKYIRYDSMIIAMQYLGMAIRGIPYMGVGRNLAYRRTKFFEKKGFGAHNHIMSGDDDLFINANALKTDTKVEYSNGSHTRSVPAFSPIEYIKQKHRHLTTAKYYKPADQILLILEPLTRITFYTLAIILVSFLFFWPYVLAIFGLRMIAQIGVIYLIQKRLNEPKILPYSLIFDIFSPLINCALYFTTQWNRPGKNSWK
jgi:poly-beta-1,6-N-acetyl-D-glucosamine synthase